MTTYFMVYNMSLSVPNTFTNWASSMQKDKKLLSLKFGMDNAIMEQKAIETKLGYIPYVWMDLMDFPRTPDRMAAGLDGLTMQGAFYMVMIPLTSFILIFDQLMREKVDRIRLGMQLLGT